MHKFDALSLNDKLAHFTDVARRALPLWGLPKDSTLKLLNFTENATFLVTTGDGRRQIMRVHRLDYATENSIRTELSWIFALRRETDLSLAKPLPMQNGEYVATIETPALSEARHVVCFSFVPGEPPKDSSDSDAAVGEIIRKTAWIPKSVSCPLFKAAASVSDLGGPRPSKMTARDRSVYQTIGKILATLHRQSRCWQAPSCFERIEWDLEGTFGKQNNFYNTTYADPRWLSPGEIAAIDRARNVIEARLAAYGKGPSRYGMIHSDLRCANLLRDGEKITVLDFDDCGRGWYMYDIASVLSFMEHRKDWKEVLSEITAGYETILPIPEEDRAELPTFVMLRRIGLLESLLSRIGCVAAGSGEAAELTPEILSFYARGTADLSRRYVRDYAARQVPAFEVSHAGSPIYS